MYAAQFTHKVLPIKTDFVNAFFSYYPSNYCNKDRGISIQVYPKGDTTADFLFEVAHDDNKLTTSPDLILEAVAFRVGITKVKN